MGGLGGEREVCTLAGVMRVGGREVCTVAVLAVAFERLVIVAAVRVVVAVGV